MTEKVLIAGDGPCAIHTARKLSENGIETLLVSRKSMDAVQSSAGADTGQEIGFPVLERTQILHCGGCVNDFQVSMRTDAETLTDRFSGIVIAEEYARRENFQDYGLQPGAAVIASSALAGMIDGRADQELPLQSGNRVLFLTGCAGESNPVILREVMNGALRLQKEFHQEVFILTGNLKVAGNGLEALYRTAREAGVIFSKVTRALPDLQQADDGGVTVVYRDEVLQADMKLSPDLVVVDETILPGRNLGALAKVFDVKQDAAGFVQSDNVHREPVFTNRRGILAAGPSRGVLEARDQLGDAGTVVWALKDWWNKRTELGSGGKAKIGVVECARCITCYRICPYRAIRLEDRVTVYPDACEGCGICVAECPREYIKWTGPGIPDQLETIRIRGMAEDGGDFVPEVVAFCCARSAARSLRAAKIKAPERIDSLKVVEVPCAGGISTDHLLQTFAKGADGILVLTCHEGNCHSEVGNQYAQNRTRDVAARLSVMGFEQERLQLHTIAANMDTELIRILDTFVDEIRQIGPSPIRKNRKGK